MTTIGTAPRPTSGLHRCHRRRANCHQAQRATHATPLSLHHHTPTAACYDPNIVCSFVATLASIAMSVDQHQRSQSPNLPSRASHRAFASHRPRTSIWDHTCPLSIVQMVGLPSGGAAFGLGFTQSRPRNAMNPLSIPASL